MVTIDSLRGGEMGGLGLPSVALGFVGLVLGSGQVDGTHDRGGRGAFDTAWGRRGGKFETLRAGGSFECWQGLVWRGDGARQAAH